MKEQMPNESINQTPSIESGMNIEEAQLEANMMRVKLKEMLKHEPTAEDYDQALRAVEEMKELAANEPEFDKIFLKLMQIGNKYFQKVPEGLVWLLRLGNYPKDQIDVEVREFHLHMFDDAVAKLNHLKEKAEKFEQDK